MSHGFRHDFRVVRAKSSGGRSCFFSYGNILFSVLAAGIIVPAEDQYVEIVGANGKIKKVIEFWDSYRGGAFWILAHGSDMPKEIQAYQFDVGDRFSIVTKNVHPAGDDLSTAIRDSYVQARIARHIELAEARGGKNIRHFTPAQRNEFIEPFRRKALAIANQIPPVPLNFQEKAEMVLE